MIYLSIQENPASVTLLDDAESTPGISRQQTRFKEDVQTELTQAIEKTGKADDKIMSSVLKKHNFKLLEATHFERGFVLAGIESTEK